MATKQTSVREEPSILAWMFDKMSSFWRGGMFAAGYLTTMWLYKTFMPHAEMQQAWDYAMTFGMGVAWHAFLCYSFAVPLLWIFVRSVNVNVAAELRKKEKKVEKKPEQRPAQPTQHEDRRPKFPHSNHGWRTHVSDHES